MKVLWDNLHPELNYFNGKYLRQKSTYITQRGYILETRAEHDEETNVIAENAVGPSTSENGNITEMISTPSQAEYVYKAVRIIDNRELYDTLQRGFEENYKVYESIETERTELTTVRKKPNEEELSLINLIAKEYLDKETSSKQLSFEVINSLIYSSAATFKQYLSDTTVKPSNERISTEPKWVVQFTTKINRIRRDIAHIELIQKCKQMNSYTANQKGIRNRSIRKYRNIKEHTLTYHIKCLKQELKATSSCLNHLKKVSERKRINKLFSTNPRSVYRSLKGMTYGEQLGTSTRARSSSTCFKKSIVIKFNLKIITSILTHYKQR